MPFGYSAVTRTAVFVVALSRRGSLRPSRDGREGRSAPVGRRASRAWKGAPCSRRSSPISKRALLLNRARRKPGGPSPARCEPQPETWTAPARRNLPALRAVDAGERLERMQKHAAAMQAMFGEMAKAYEAVAPSLTDEQRDILSRNMVPSHPHQGAFRPRDMAANCGPAEEFASLGAAAALIASPCLSDRERTRCRHFFSQATSSAGPP